MRVTPQNGHAQRSQIATVLGGNDEQSPHLGVNCLTATCLELILPGYRADSMQTSGPKSRRPPQKPFKSLDTCRLKIDAKPLHETLHKLLNGNA